MNQPHDANQPIEVLFDQIEDAVDFAAAGNTPFTNEQIVNAACNLVFDTGMFSDECKEWQKKETANKTWDEFKLRFAEAHQDLQESQATARSAGYSGSANAVTQDTEALDALAQLANATTADRATITTLTQQVKDLQDENKKLNEKLVETLEKIAQMCSIVPAAQAPKKRERFYC